MRLKKGKDFFFLFVERVPAVISCSPIVISCLYYTCAFRRIVRNCWLRRRLPILAEAGSFADRVKQQADIVRVVGEYVRLKKNGQNFTGLCPFHSEKTPSFAVHPVKQIYHCFGCGVGGGVFKFVMEMDKCELMEAGQ